MLDPDVVLRADSEAGSATVDRGAPAVAERMLDYARLAGISADDLD